MTPGPLEPPVSAPAMPLTSPIPTATTASLVKAVRLGKSIDERPILTDLNLNLGQGRFLALLGANGAGKSTLLKILSTLLPASSGALHLFGHDLTKAHSGHAVNEVRARIGLIGHPSMLYHDLSARENLVFFGRLYAVKDPFPRADHLLAAVGLSARAHDPVKAFSRGMIQRVAIARALMHNPDLLLADEPFAGLDAPSTQMLERVLTDLHAAGKTIILANHDIGQSLRLAEHAIVLRQGRKVIDQPTFQLDTATVLREMDGAGAKPAGAGGAA